jgi:hypothetical protein
MRGELKGAFLNELPLDAATPQPPKRLTQNLVQLHNSGIGPNPLDSLGLLGHVALLEDLLIVADWLVGRHAGSIGVSFGGRSVAVEGETEKRRGEGEKEFENSQMGEGWWGVCAALLDGSVQARV